MYTQKLFQNGKQYCTKTSDNGLTVISNSQTALNDILSISSDLGSYSCSAVHIYSNN